MIIYLSPMRRDAPIEVSVSGDILSIDGEAFDFSAIREGETLSQQDAGCPWLAGDVTRSGGEIILTLILPHGPNAPAETLFPTAISVTTDGPVALPAFDMPVVEENPDAPPPE